jgi:hypothetical protein
MLFSSRSICNLLLLLLSIPLSACSHGPPVGKISGEVTLDGSPLKEGNILFTPVDGQGQPTGDKITDGKFTVESPVGNMQVQITANEVIGQEPAYAGDPKSPMIQKLRELIPKRYNAQSELTLDVKPGPQTVKYELKK